jgi:hypothetical protein
MADQPKEKSRAGVRWTNEEDKKLIDSATSGTGIKDIALAHQRTVGSIVSRIAINAILAMKNDNLSVEEAAKKFHISPDYLETTKAEHERREKCSAELKARKAVDTKPPTNPNPKTITSQDFMDILVEIRDLLKETLHKLHGNEIGNA